MAVRISRASSATVSFSTPQEIIINHADDSIRLGDGTNLFTGTVVGAKKALDVSIISGGVTLEGLSTGYRVTRMTITDTATLVPATPLANRDSVSVRVIGAEPVYVVNNGSGTAAQGYPKYYREELVMDVKDNAAVQFYLVCEPGKSSEIAILELA